MKKAGLFFLVCVILGGWAVKDSDAAQWCWQMTAADYVKLSVVKPDPLYPFWSLNGMWYEPGIAIIPLVGTMVKNADGTGRVLTLYGTYPGTASQSYAINVEIDAITRNGTFHIHYIPDNSNLDVSITKVSCGTMPAP